MRTIACLFSVLLAPLANAAEWHSLGKNNLLEANIDVSSIQRRDGRLAADILMEYMTEQTSEEMPKPYRSILMSWVFDCQLGRATTLRIDVFSGPTATGELVSRDVMKDVDSHWREIPAAGLQRAAFTFVCSKVPQEQ